MFIAILMVVSPLAAFPQEEEPDASERYRSIRGTVYSKTLRRVENDGYGARLKFQLSGAMYKYESVDELLDPDIVHWQSLGIRPSLSFELPTRWTNIDFIPSMDLSVTRQFDTEQTLLAASGTIAFRYMNKKADSQTTTIASLKYGTRHEDDGLNFDDYLRLKLRVRFRQNLKWTIGESITTITPFASASYFLDELESGIPEEDFINSVEKEYELGITLSTLPRLRLWKIKIPEIDLSYTFGDDRRGFKIRF